MIETQDLLLENQFLKQELQQVKEKSDSEIAYLNFQLEELKRMIFGAKSERFVSHIILRQLSIPLEKIEVKEAEKELITIDAEIFLLIENKIIRIIK